MLKLPQKYFTRVSTLKHPCLTITQKRRPVGAGDVGGAKAPIDFDKSVSHLKWGVRLYPPLYYCPPDFWTLLRLYWRNFCEFCVRGSSCLDLFNCIFQSRRNLADVGKFVSEVEPARAISFGTSAQCKDTLYSAYVVVPFDHWCIY